MREKRTDERMDDLSHRVDGGFNRVDADLRTLRSEMQAGFARSHDRFDAMNRTLVQFASALIAALVALFAAQIGVIVSLL